MVIYPSIDDLSPLTGCSPHEQALATRLISPLYVTCTFTASSTSRQLRLFDRLGFHGTFNTI